MIVATHPDDAELTMGGTLIKMIEAGWEVVVVDLTDGEPTPLGSKELRAQETQKSMDILGLKTRLCLNMPNRYLEATLANRRKLAETIRIHRPDMIFGPVSEDYHPDHLAASQLVSAARFEAKFHKTDMQGDPYWCSRQYQYFSTNKVNKIIPSFVVDITSEWEKKVQAIGAYQSQLHTVGSSGQPLLLEHVTAICRYFGHCTGTQYGEPFLSCELPSIKNVRYLMCN